MIFKPVYVRRFKPVHTKSFMPVYIKAFKSVYTKSIKPVYVKAFKPSTPNFPKNVLKLPKIEPKVSKGPIVPQIDQKDTKSPQ